MPVPPPTTHTHTFTSLLPPSLPLALLFSLFHSHSFYLSPPRRLSASPLSLFSVRASPPSVASGVKQGPVCSQALLVPASSYLLESRAAVALLCVTAQPCLFSPTGSCLSWLWTSFKTCPVSAPSSNTRTANCLYRSECAKAAVHSAALARSSSAAWVCFILFFLTVECVVRSGLSVG